LDSRLELEGLRLNHKGTNGARTKKFLYILVGPVSLGLGWLELWRAGGAIAFKMKTWVYCFEIIMSGLDSGWETKGLPLNRIGISSVLSHFVPLGLGWVEPFWAGPRPSAFQIKTNKHLLF